MVAAGTVLQWHMNTMAIQRFDPTLSDQHCGRSDAGSPIFCAMYRKFDQVAASICRGARSGVTMIKDPVFSFEIAAIICATGLAAIMVFG